MLPRARLRLVCAALGVWAAVVVVRLGQLQLLEHRSWRREAEGQSERIQRQREARGEIVTRDGRVLAGSSASVSVCCNPTRIPGAQRERVAAGLASLVGIPATEILRRFSSEEGFFYLAKDLDPAVAPAVRRLRQRGVWTESVENRIYPHATLAGPVIGFVDAEGVGQAGLERFYEKTLAGVPSEYRLLCDGKTLPTAIDLRLEKLGRPGRSLILAIDSRIQLVVEQELVRTLEEVGGSGAAAVVMHPATGELLAVASVPGYDPGRPGAVEAATRRNRAVEDAIEPGSTFKPIIVAAALGSGVVAPWELVDCSGGGVEVAGVFIRDHHDYGILPVTEVIARSSNAGAIRIAHRLAPAQLDELVRGLGFGATTGVELPAETSGLYRGPERWSALSRAGLALGQEITASPLQLARAYAAIANRGVLPRPLLVLETRDSDGRTVAPHRPVAGQRVLPERIADQVRDMLVATVEHGTGVPAGVLGYRVAGKTGTAQKAGEGGLRSGRHAAWFAGFFPAERPVAVLVVLVDEPRATYWANDVAAPAFGRIASRLATLLGIAPTAPEAA